MITSRDIIASECNKLPEVISLSQDSRGCFYFTMRHRTTGDPLNLSNMGSYELPPPEDIPCPVCDGQSTDSSSSSSVASSLSSSSSSSGNNPDCGPYDFDALAFRVFITAVPCFSNTEIDRLFQIEGCVTDYERGLVKFCLSKTELAWAGIHMAQVGLWQGDDLLYVNNLYLEVIPSLISANASQGNGPITIPEIRLRMRDMCSEGNRLLDSVEFKDSEIAASIRMPIDYWNDTPPAISHFTPATFPYRYYWMTGTCALLLQSAAMHYAREHLDYSAGGVSVSDKNKAQAYQMLGDNYWKEFIAWVRSKKAEINMESCWYSIGSDY